MEEHFIEALRHKGDTVALIFQVGNPTEIFAEPYGSNLRQALEHHFGSGMNLQSPEAPWSSADLGWSYWSELQSRASEVMSVEQIPHLLSMGAWRGVYLPLENVMGTLDQVCGDTTPLDIASLPSLIAELEAFGRAADLPTDDDGLRELMRKYTDNDDLGDENLDIQAYTQLLLGAHLASKGNQPLWVVK